jgi:D-alanyl-D-alanine carboxypeptidase
MSSLGVIQWIPILETIGFGNTSNPKMYPPAKFTRRSFCASLLIPRARLKGASQPLDQLLAQARIQGNLPALQAATFSSGRTIEIRTAGVRRSGSPELATLDNSFHFGSIAKGFTATLVARLAESGVLSWDIRPIDVIPELRASIHPDYRIITIDDLLLWRAGVAPFLAPSAPEYQAVPRFSGDPIEQRRGFALHVLRNAPTYPPRSKTVYSNGSYGIVGAMVEALTRKSWDQLITTEILQPLKINGGSGWPAAKNRNETWGHFETENGLRPHDPGDSYQFPAWMQPGGDLHMRLRNYITFLQENLRGLRGHSSLLKRESFRRLHSPWDGENGRGWGTGDGGKSSEQAGSAMTFLAIGRIWPEEDRGLAVVCNAGGRRATKQCSDLAAVLGKAPHQ